MPHLDVYGVDHSPWVQAVLLGIHEKGASHTLRSVAPLPVFVKTGIMMPAASIDHEPWQLESADILERLGYEPVSTEDMTTIYGAWGGVLHRPDSAWDFIRGFSAMREQSESLPRRCWNHFLRSFTALYFFTIIRLMALSGRMPDPENFSEQFLVLQKNLEETPGPFWGGTVPDMRDLMLFGIVQCHASIPVPPLEALREDPRLDAMRSWIAAMQERFAGYSHIYSGAYFEPRSAPPTEASRLEKTCFWLGVGTMLSAFPVTLGLFIFYGARAQRGPKKAVSGEST